MASIFPPRYFLDFALSSLDRCPIGCIGTFVVGVCHVCIYVLAKSPFGFGATYRARSKDFAIPYWTYCVGPWCSCRWGFSWLKRIPICINRIFVCTVIFSVTSCKFVIIMLFYVYEWPTLILSSNVSYQMQYHYYANFSWSVHQKGCNVSSVQLNLITFSLQMAASIYFRTSSLLLLHQSSV